MAGKLVSVVQLMAVGLDEKFADVVVRVKESLTEASEPSMTLNVAAVELKFRADTS